MLGNGLLPSGKQESTGPMLTQIYLTTRFHKVTMRNILHEINIV